MECGIKQYGAPIIYSVNPMYDDKVRSKVRCLFENDTEYETDQCIIKDHMFMDFSYIHPS